MRYGHTIVGLSLLLLAGFGLLACSPGELGDGFPEGFDPGSAYHEAGWGKPRTHGQAFLEDHASCALCHGEARDGGISKVSCNQCHTGWEQNCTFCHGGGPASTRGNPPYDTKGQRDSSLNSIGAHVAHMTNGPAYLALDCTVCHVVPEELFSDGHFDGRVDVILGSRAGAEARYENGTCSSVYCHGGADSTISWTAGGPLSCVACHGDDTTPERLSGSHGAHFDLGLDCESCHRSVLAANRVFVDRALHVNGAVDVALSLGTYDRETKNCLNTCHETRSWGGTVHPSGWMAPGAHGQAFFMATGKACTDCHGADYRGGSSGVSCDSCHTGGTIAWRTSCTFCHGGTDNQTGAPPRAVRTTENKDAVIGAHTVHVTAADGRRAFTCTECHVTPQSFDDPGHIDRGASPRVVFAGSELSPDGAYDPATGTCSSVYCHGDGRRPGQAVWTGSGMSCTSCHGDESGNPTALSGRHGMHFRRDMGCVDCHAGVVNAGREIIDPDLHIDGVPNVSFPGGGEWDAANRRCSNVVCHPSTVSW